MIASKVLKVLRLDPGTTRPERGHEERCVTFSENPNGEQLAVLLGLLEDGPQSSIDLRKAMGVSIREIGRLCTRLAALKRIHYVGKQMGGIGRPPAIWRIGPKDNNDLSAFSRHTVSGLSVLEQIKKAGEPVHVRQLMALLNTSPRAINQALYRLEKKGLIEIYDRIPHPDVHQAKQLARWVAVENRGEEPETKMHSVIKRVLEKIQEIGEPVTTIELVDLLGVTKCAVKDALTRLRRKGVIEICDWAPHPKVSGSRVARWQVRGATTGRPVLVPKPRGVSKIYITQDDLEWMEQWKNYKAKKMSINGSI